MDSQFSIGFLYAVLGAYVVIYESCREKIRGWDSLTLFNGCFVIYYPLAGMFYHWGGITADKMDQLGRYVPESTVIAPILVFTGYNVVLLSYAFACRRMQMRAILLIPRSPEHNRRAALMLAGLVAGVMVAFFVYSAGYGGVFRLYSEARELRLGSIERNLNVTWIGRFLPVVGIPMVVFLAMWHASDEGNTRNRYQCLFAVSLIVYVFVSFGHGGRARLIGGLVMLPFALSVCRMRLSFRAVSIAVALIFVGILFGNALFKSVFALEDGMSAFWAELAFQTELLRPGNLWASCIDFMGYFEHRVYSLNVALDFMPSHPEWHTKLREFPSAVISLIPAALWNLPQGGGTIDVNNAIIWYARPQDSSVPPGWLATGFYSWNYFGVLVYAVWIGVLGGIIEGSFGKSLKSSAVLQGLYTIAAFWWANNVQLGEPTKLLRDTISTIVVVTLLVLLIFRIQTFTARGQRATMYRLAERVGRGHGLVRPFARTRRGCGTQTPSRSNTPQRASVSTASAKFR